MKRKNTFGRKMRENAVISSKYDFRHQRLNESPICALEDEVDFVVLKLEEYAFPVYQDLSDVASQLEKRKSQHRRTEPIAAWLGGSQVLQVPRGENLQKNLHFHHLFSFNL